MFKRIVLWIILLSLTVLIFLFPTHLTFSMQPIQSLYIFKNLPLFVILFLGWVITLVWLFVLNKNNLLRMALIGIFAIVFLGFWVVITPYGLLMDYQPAGIAYVKEILSYRVISPAYWVNFGYLDFPLTPYFGAIVSKITSLSIFNMRTLILLINSALLGVSLYIFLKNMLKNTTLAFVGAILAIIGNMMLCNSLRFYPAGFGLILFAVFLALVIKGGVIFESKWDKIIAVVLMLAITATHYITSFYVVAILLGIFAVQLVTREKLVKWWFIFVLAVIPVLWGLLVTNSMLQNMFGISLQNVQQIITNPTTTNSSTFSLWWVRDMAISYLGAQNPLWVRMIIAFWTIAVFIFGSIVALVNLFRIRKLSGNLKTLTGAMLGVFLLSILAVFTSLNIGGYQFFRFLQFGGFFLVPIILIFILSLKFNKVVIIGCSVLLFVLVLPTFLVNNSTIEANVVYPQELQAGQYLQSSYGNGSGLIVYTDAETSGILLYYLPNANYVIDDPLDVTNQEDFVQWAKQIFTQFNNDPRDTVFVLSPRLQWGYVHNLNMSISSPELVKVSNDFSNNIELYDNGMVQVYKGEGE